MSSVITRFDTNINLKWILQEKNIDKQILIANFYSLTYLPTYHKTTIKLAMVHYGCLQFFYNNTLIPIIKPKPKL